MPPVSKKQARMMNAAAHNPEFAAEVGVSKKVAEEFSASGKQYQRLPESRGRVMKKKK